MLLSTLLDEISPFLEWEVTTQGPWGIIKMFENELW